MEELINDYCNEVLTIKELASKYHMGQDKVKKILKDNKIEIRTPVETKIAKKNLGISLQEIEQKVVENYQKGWGQLRSGKEFGLSSQEVKKILSRNNIEIRDFSQANSQDPTTMRYKKNKNFFKTESSDMAWLLGFLASSSTISSNGNRIKIELADVDKEILEKIKILCEIENPICKKEDKRGINFVSLEWSCKEHKEDLAKYNILPNKSKSLLPPALLSKDYYIDYIRGYFDGNGMVSFSNNSLKWSISSESIVLLQWIMSVLYTYYKIQPVVLFHNQNGFYNFTYLDDAAAHIYQILYTPNSIYLQRKKDKFDNLLISIKE